MNLYIKNFVIYSVIAFFVTVFGFHWFFTFGMMPAQECLSVNCVYSSPQAMPSDQILSVIFLTALLAVLLWFTRLDKNSKEILIIPAVFRERFALFDYKINSWLKILEKKDPVAYAMTASRRGF